ncbi:MAG TPA: acetyl-CoA carboxylase biotin carboxylase subunit [Ktedonobacteraceae bacterium]|nr:acetyl-CoA carboxylase biotin carboxylase subunit [Ktedonobacteraceae bacterium]
MFTKILIANRGEIAVRIMATCREMGIRTVAIYSDADRNALHVRKADEAYAIGPAPASQSYLQIQTILAIAQQCGAQAIHPGYGFLAENAAFVEACTAAGIVFIGPPAPAMRLMGSKIAAKRLALAVDAPIIPGYNGDSQEDAVLAREAERIGFPLLIKASAGGGGKGMREVHSSADFAAQLAGARREALAAFADGTVFLERLLQQPRHVEIQVLGDTFGNLIHLGERECSIQRRHQKIVEESPSIALTPALRAKMGATAVNIAREAGYVNAGTMEFILDSDGRFYFLEMNTRLQVEHPVTELVTGIDLVRHQLLIAAGEPLQLTQEQIHPRGHAIEMRLYAEDPAQNFLPATGTITRFIQPVGPGIRIDSGIESGDEITQFYDPMIAKMIVYAEDRPAAIARMQDVLAQSVVFGVKTNLSLLNSIAAHPAFKAGLTHTGFLQEHNLLGDTLPQENIVLPVEVLLAAALYDNTADAGASSDYNGHTSFAKQSSATPWQTFGPWRMIGESRRITYIFQGKEYNIALRPTSDGMGIWSVQINNQTAENITYMLGNDDIVWLRRGANQARTYVQHTKDETQVFFRGQAYTLKRHQPPTVEAAARDSNVTHIQKVLAAPMAGTIIKVQAHDGDTVEQRQVLVILSAMKMEHSISAPYAGKVRRIYVQEGAVVKGGAAIVEME